MRMEELSEQGYLEIIAGPMFSGKTSKLIEIYKQCSFCDIPVAVINYIGDVRYHETMLSSHDKNMIPCIQSQTLSDIWCLDKTQGYNKNQIECFNAKVILINEGQFFPDLYKVVNSMINEKKHVYIAGLDGDFQRQKFGQILDLIPLCDSFVKLHSLCNLCKNGSKAIFSLRLTSELSQTVIGSDNYIPVCRKCYVAKNE